MKNRGTVQNPLGPSELFELIETAIQQMPRNLDAGKVRADLKNKKSLGRDLAKFFRDRYAAQSLVDLASWNDFYRRIFGKEANLTSIEVAPKPDYPCWPIVIVPGLVTNNDAFDASKLFGDAWRYQSDLNTVIDIVERPKIPYVKWVKAVVEADSDLKNVSAESIAERKLDTITLLERLILGLKHFDETKAHLDVENWTLCAGSRCAHGGVPCVHWFPASRGLYVRCYDVRGASGYVRARAAV